MGEFPPKIIWDCFVLMTAAAHAGFTGSVWGVTFVGGMEGWVGGPEKEVSYYLLGESCAPVALKDL